LIHAKQDKTKLTNQTQDNGNSMYFLMGMLVGGLAGTAAMLLMAPQSGKDTRDQIQAKGIELRDEATVTAENAVEQVRLKGQKLSSDMREKAGELQQRGQNLIDDQREQLSSLVAGDSNGVKLSS
jgi:gas vesicle protein